MVSWFMVGGLIEEFIGECWNMTVCFTGDYMQMNGVMPTPQNGGNLNNNGDGSGGGGGGPPSLIPIANSNGPLPPNSSFHIPNSHTGDALGKALQSVSCGSVSVFF